MFLRNIREREDIVSVRNGKRCYKFNLDVSLTACVLQALYSLLK